MSRGSDVLDRLVLPSRQQRHFAALTVLGSAVLLGVVVGVGGDVHPVLTSAGLLLALLAALLPETNAPLALQLYLGLWWLVATPRRLDGWTLVAAVAFAVVHLSVTLAASAPPGTDLDPALLRRWWVRSAGCLAAAASVWLVGSVAPAHDPSAAALGVALLLVGGWCGVVAMRLARAHISTATGPP
jgi:hypothetical protein